MKHFNCYNIDLTIFDIHDKCSSGDLLYKCGGDIKESDIELLHTCLESGYPLPTLVVYIGKDTPARVLVGNRLVATISAFVTMEKYKSSVRERLFKSIHCIIIDSASLIDANNIRRLFKRFSA